MRTDGKNLEYQQLLDAYGGLLTDHQRDICELYYMYDLSLTEIAEQKGVSKQSVSDMLAKSRMLLDGYEQKLHIVQAAQREEAAAEKLSELSEKHPALAEEIAAIAALLKGESL